MTHQEKHKLDKLLRHQAEEQVMFLKHQNRMNPSDIIRMYGGKPHASETYSDAVERIAVFNLANAAKNGFVA